MIEPLLIANRSIGPGLPCFVIAEAGVNHNGDVNLAHQLIDAAVEAGSGAVKFQSFVTEDLITPDAPKARYQIETTSEPGSQYNMLKSLELSGAQQAELKAHCDKRGILYLCTPYEHGSIDMLDELSIPAFKVASTDTNNLVLLKYLAGKGRPVILSTGMSTLGEVDQAVQTLWNCGLEGKIALLHCTSEYPAPFDELNLKAIQTMQYAFGCPVGFSDHTPGVGASPWAVALGACIIEKHFTLDRTMKGPDHRASLEPKELSKLVQTIRDVESALGNGIKRPTGSEIRNKSLMQKSVVANRFLRLGTIIKPDDLTCKRPGTNLDPSWYDRLIGKQVKCDINKNEPLTLSKIEWVDGDQTSSKQ